METKRIPMPSVLDTRDGTLLKDGLLTNCYSEEGPTAKRIVKRPGLSVEGTLPGECAGQGAYYFVDGPIYVKCDTLYTETETIPDPEPGPGPGPIAVCPTGWRYGDLHIPATSTYGLAWNGTVFCVARGYGVGTSPTGEFWNYNETEFSPWSIQGQLVWNGTVFCTIAYVEPGPITSTVVQAFTSPTGHPGTWTAYHISGPDSAVPETYSMGTMGHVICAVSRVWGVASLVSYNHGLHWTVGTLPSNENWYGVAGGNGVFVAVCRWRDFCAVSLDAIHWVQIAMPFGAEWSAIAFNGEYFCAINFRTYPGGTPGPSAISYDGYTWIAGTQEWSWLNGNLCWSPVTQMWYSFYSNSISMSPDGLNWTTCPTEVTHGEVTWTIAANSTHLVVVNSWNSHPAPIGPDTAMFAPLPTLPAR